jgi:hypothetical protein
VLDDLGGGGAWRAALDIAATKFVAGCADGGQVAKDTPRPGEGADRRVPKKPVPQKPGEV